MHLIRTIFTNREYQLLLLILLLFSLLRLPSLFEPNWYGDEGIYQVLGQAIRDGKILYLDAWDNKPPLLYLTYALANADHFTIRLLSYVAGILAVVTMYPLSFRLFKTQKLALTSTGLFALLFATPLIEGNIANAENFILVFTIAAAYFFYLSITHERKKRTLFLAGFLLGLAILFKIVAIFDAAAFAAFALFLSSGKMNKHVVVSTAKKVQPFIIGLAIPLLASLSYFFLVHALGDYLHATLFSNVSYVNYRNQFFIPQGFLLLKLFFLAIGLGFIYWRRQILSKEALFVLTWVLFSLFNVFFSQRPYTHYVLVILPSLSLLLGLIFFDKRYRLFFGVLFVAVVIVLTATFRLTAFSKVLAYYDNFTSFVFAQKPLREYQVFFDGDVPRDYALASFITEHKDENDEVFFWGNTAQLYTLTGTTPPGRYVVSYHINSIRAIDEVQQILDAEKPRFFVVVHDATIPQIMLRSYLYKANVEGNVIYERAY